MALQVVNFCPVIPELVSLDERERRSGYELFRWPSSWPVFRVRHDPDRQLHAAPAFLGERPYKEMLNYGIEFRVAGRPRLRLGRAMARAGGHLPALRAVARQAGLPFCLEPRVGEIISNTDALLRLMDHVGRRQFWRRAGHGPPARPERDPAAQRGEAG